MKEGLLLECGYHLDGSDPGIVVLRRQGGAFVAAFSAKEDYGKLIGARKANPLLGFRGDGDRKGSAWRVPAGEA